jgi:hypothetical protein
MVVEQQDSTLDTLTFLLPPWCGELLLPFPIASVLAQMGIALFFLLDAFALMAGSDVSHP